MLRQLSYKWRHEPFTKQLNQLSLKERKKEREYTIRYPEADQYALRSQPTRTSSESERIDDWKDLGIKSKGGRAVLIAGEGSPVPSDYTKKPEEEKKRHYSTAPYRTVPYPDQVMSS